MIEGLEQIFGIIGLSGIVGFGFGMGFWFVYKILVE